MQKSERDQSKFESETKNALNTTMNESTECVSKTL